MGHPLLWHLVRRLLWTLFDGDGDGDGDGSGGVAALRVAEDRSFADAHDNPLVLDDAAAVGIAHPLHLGTALPRWADVLADYEIVQPFPQLGREVYRLTDDEWAATTLLRVTDASVATGKVLGLTRRGWRPGVRQSGGDLMWLDRPLGDGTILVVELDPGIPVAGLPAEPEQRLQRIGLDAGARSGWDSVDALPLERLDPVTASELIRDLTDLTA